MSGIIMDENLELEEDTQKDKYLTFSIGNENYGIDIKYVTEIIGIQSIIEIPEQPDYIKGIINLRGKIIPLMDVRIRFMKEQKEYNDRTCVIIVDINSISVGLIVDSVCEVVNISEENVVPPPYINKDIENKYIKSIGKVLNDVTLVLDCEKLLSHDEIDNLSELNNT